MREQAHDYRQKMKDIASEKILDTPPGTYDDAVMQEIKKHVWDGSNYSNLRKKLLKKRPDLLSEEDVKGLQDRDSLDYIMALPPEQRKQHLTGWQRSIEMFLDDPDMMMEPRIAKDLEKFHMTPDAKTPIPNRNWLDEAAMSIGGLTHRAVFEPAQALFNPIPETTVQKIVNYVSGVDEQFNAPISESKYYNHLLSNAVHTFSMTDTDTPTVQRFYESLLPRVGIPEIRGKTMGIPFESIGRAIARLGENGTGFLPWIEQNLTEQTQRMEDLRAKENTGEKMHGPRGQGIEEFRKTAEDNVEKLLHIKDSIETGTGNSQKYKFYDDKRWAKNLKNIYRTAWVRKECRLY